MPIKRQKVSHGDSILESRNVDLTASLESSQSENMRNVARQRPKKFNLEKNTWEDLQYWEDLQKLTASSSCSLILKPFVRPPKATFDLKGTIKPSSLLIPSNGSSENNDCVWKDITNLVARLPTAKNNIDPSSLLLPCSSLTTTATKPKEDKVDKGQSFKKPRFKTESNGSYENNTGATLSELFKRKDGVWSRTTTATKPKEVKKPRAETGSNGLHKNNTAITLSELFKLQDGIWRCKTCAIVNNAENIECVACKVLRD